MSSRTDDRTGTFLEVGIWLLFFALLVPAGVVGYVIGRDARPVDRPGHNAPVSASAAASWALPNGDLFNTRNTREATISSANVSRLGVAWTMPPTHHSLNVNRAQFPARRNSAKSWRKPDSR